MLADPSRRPGHRAPAILRALATIGASSLLTAARFRAAVRDRWRVEGVAVTAALAIASGADAIPARVARMANAAVRGFDAGSAGP